jgi:hypothetical protein
MKKTAKRELKSINLKLIDLRRLAGALGGATSEVVSEKVGPDH